MSRLVGPPDERGHCDGIAVRLCSAMTGAGWEVGPGGVSSAPFLGLALRLGWATLRPVPSSGIRGPYTRRSARSSRLSLSVDHMALRDRWAAAAAAACSLDFRDTSCSQQTALARKASDEQVQVCRCGTQTALP